MTGAGLRQSDWAVSRDEGQRRQLCRPLEWGQADWGRDSRSGKSARTRAPSSCSHSCCVTVTCTVAERVLHAASLRLLLPVGKRR